MEKIKGLVSICVVTYNSGKVIGETLDSIVEQTYQNIELIISDDSSKDDTMLVVKNWLEKNKARFVRTALLETDSNTGVTANCNRACKAARGEFVKLIGDDILLPEYVSEFVAYFREHTETQILFSRVQLLDNDAKTLSDDDKHDYDFFNLTAAEQFKSIIQHLGLYIPTCSAFYRAEVLEKMDYFDESIPMWEDGPIYFRLAESGVKFELLDKILVQYRICLNSLSHGRSPIIEKSGAKFYLKYFYKYDKKNNYLKSKMHLFRNYLLISDSGLAKILLIIFRKIKQTFIGMN